MNNLKVGDSVTLLKSIYDDGEDHHPAGYIAEAYEVVLIDTVYENGKLAVHHPDVTNGSCFLIYNGEYVSVQFQDPQPNNPDGF
jgi:hypothetical protein